ncbi:MAG: hypothetical protein QF491_13525, partial [Alphaproteobacteria bacterium]|nr:hypothetical protein [Alphaproteobacteria bacterium]
MRGRRSFNPFLAAVFGGLLLIFVAYAGRPASAAIIYTSHLEQHALNLVYATGSNFVSGCKSVAGGGFICGTVDIIGTQINTSGSAGTGGGTAAGVDANGRWEVNDLIFTDVNNPGASGSISVRANFFLDFLTTRKIQVSSGIGGIPFALNQTFYIGATTNVSTAFVTVPLNTLLTFSATADLRVDDTNPSGNSSGTGLFELASIPFDLPQGYTVNSADAGITNNRLSSAVPEPATLPLLLAGI